VNAHDTVNPENAAVLASASGRRSGSQEDAPSDDFEPQVVHNVTAPGGGVTAVSQKVEPPYVFAFAPGDLNADADGLVARPNVDVAAELVRVRQAETLYKANVRVLQAEDRLIGMLLNDRV
jgi:flagellar basal-body rod protein FlgC